MSQKLEVCGVCMTMRWAAVPFLMIALVVAFFWGAHWGKMTFAVLLVVAALGFFVGLCIDLNRKASRESKTLEDVVRLYITQSMLDSKHAAVVLSGQELLSSLKFVPPEDPRWLAKPISETPADVLRLRDRRARLIYQIEQNMNDYDDTRRLISKIVGSQPAGVLRVPERAPFDPAEMASKATPLFSITPMDEFMRCPGCGFQSARWLHECPKCGTFVDGTGLADEKPAPKQMQYEKGVCESCFEGLDIGEACDNCGRVGNVDDLDRIRTY